MSHYSMGLRVSVIGIWNNEPLFWLKQAFSYSGIFDISHSQGQDDMYFYEKEGGRSTFSKIYISRNSYIRFGQEMFFSIVFKEH